MKQNFYELLGVVPDATAASIDAAWAALQSAEPDDEDGRNRLLFTRHAYATLSDRDARRRYDESLAEVAIPQLVIDANPQRRHFSPLLKIALFLAAAIATGYSMLPAIDVIKPPPARVTATTSSPALPEPAAAAPVVEVATGPVQLIERMAPAPVKPVATGTPINESPTASDTSPWLTKAVKSVFQIAGPAGIGSGVKVAQDKLLTNCHVVVPNANAGHVAAVDPLTGNKYPITEVAWVKLKDACVALAPGLPGTAIDIGDSGRLAAGDKVFTLGFSGGSRLSASEGLFVGLEERNDQTFVTSTNNCQSGASGGPLVDARGNLVGLVTGGRQRGESTCASVTVETALAVTRETSMPLGMLPKYYDSNVTAPLNKR